MTKIFIVGGEHKKYNYLSKKEWYTSKQGIIIELDLDTNEGRICTQYISPPDVSAEDLSSTTFKAGTICNNKFYVPTLTEVLIYQLPNFEQIGYISLPCFNDLHHVVPTDNDSLLVVSTGLDMVVKVSPSGERLQEWNVLGKNPWHKFSPDIDYRKWATTKPHESHPNYVSLIGDRIWVTRFEQKDAVCLQNQAETINIGIEGAHDGIYFDNYIFFTTVNGYVVKADVDTKQIVEVYNLNEISDKDNSVGLGWCRGLKILDNNFAVVGFSRLRPTKFIKNIQWLRYNLGLKEIKEQLPTRVVLLDLKERKIIKEFVVEDYCVNMIFSVN